MSNGPMDTSLFQWIIDGVVAVALFIFKQHADTVKDNQKQHDEEMKALRNEMTEVKVNYVPKADLLEFKKELFARFDKLDNKLEDIIQK